MIAYIIVSLITFPMYCFIIFYLYLFKTIMSYLMKLKYGNKLERMECADILWCVGENYHNLINIVMFLKEKVKGDNDVEKDAKKVIQERLLKYPNKFGKTMCSIRTYLGFAFLVRENVSPNDFVNVIDVSNSKYNSMQDILFAYSNKPMPKGDKLMWEIIVIKASSQWKKDNNISENHIPIFIRINHVIADGLSVLNLCAQVLGENNVNMDDCIKNIPRSEPWTQLPPIKGFQKLLLFWITPGYLIVEFFKAEINKYNGPVTSTKRNVAYRSEKKGENLLETIKSLKREIPDTSFSEVVLTAVSASLFSHFQKHYHKVPSSVSIAVVATRDLEPMTVDGVPVLRNQFGLVNLEIPIRTGSSSHLFRLELLKKNTRMLLKKPDLMIRNYISFNLLYYIPLPLLQRLIRLNGVWGLISNLPPYPRVVLFNGYEAEDAFFFTPQRDQMATGFNIISYDNRMHFGFVADVASVASQNDCEDIVNDIFTNINLLRMEVQKEKLNKT